MAPWIRQEVVQRRSWLDERRFVSGMALSQIAPGPNGVNLAVFVGTALRGAPGALTAFAGLMAVPVVFLISVGALYFSRGKLDMGAWLGTVLTGMGAAAIGLSLANALRLTPRNVKGVRGWAVMSATAVAVGILRLPLLWVLAVALPASLILAWLEPRESGRAK